ncbi:flagellar basal-body rod protein FlgB [Anaerospora hongkongensis]|uniref:Flagellar basal body rod protein FlgB n=1 Tax=Anaerospora hongkongensis TaxID=244830 RepID=A0A4V2Q945_9FIRM|nr:flagellar basal body rod protein FlgB [Anaerospora hongkongensis]TCL40163.1 flagellar basal-body rod protein FlgB [Anaerospora hongkongensis]
MIQSITGSAQAYVLEKALSASSLRQKTISNNIANVNTPKFKRSEVLFEDILQQKMSGSQQLDLAKTNEKHISTQSQALAPTMRMVADNSFRTDGNNVDIDIEMANMAKNSIYYDALAQQLSRYFTTLKSVIKEGRG